MASSHGRPPRRRRDRALDRGRPAQDRAGRWRPGVARALRAPRARRCARSSRARACAGRGRDPRQGRRFVTPEPGSRRPARPRCRRPAEHHPHARRRPDAATLPGRGPVARAQGPVRRGMARPGRARRADRGGRRRDPSRCALGQGPRRLAVTGPDVRSGAPDTTRDRRPRRGCATRGPLPVGPGRRGRRRGGGLDRAWLQHRPVDDRPDGGVRDGVDADTQRVRRAAPGRCSACRCRAAGDGGSSAIAPCSRPRREPASPS